MFLVLCYDKVFVFPHFRPIPHQLQNQKHLNYDSRIFELEKQLKALDESKKIEIEAKNIQIQVLQSNIESLKDQICANAQGKKEFQSEIGMDRIFKQNTKLKIQVKNMKQHTL